MILSIASYRFHQRKGLLLFHQKCESASSRKVARHIYDFFGLSYTDILSDQDSTRIPSSDDMGDPEIQLLENAKLKTLRSLPQNPLYWGSSLYHLHMNPEHVYVKIPRWFLLYRIRGRLCELIDLDESWTKIQRGTEDSYVLAPRAPNLGRGRTIGERELLRYQSYRVADFLSLPHLYQAPAFSIDAHLSEREAA